MGSYLEPPVCRMSRAGFTPSRLSSLLSQAQGLPRAATRRRRAKRTADEVLLVYNERSPISKTVAVDYAAKRGVKNQLAVNCADSAISADNEIDRLADYRTTIETPIRAYLAAHPDIQFIVLTKGVPIRITGAATGERPDNSPPDTPLNASVDSTLAAMDYRTFPTP